MISNNVQLAGCRRDALRSRRTIEVLGDRATARGREYRPRRRHRLRLLGTEHRPELPRPRERAGRRRMRQEPDGSAARRPALSRSACDDRLSAVLRSPDIDAVAVVTPVWTHYELAKAALENGKHVFVEKPFTSTPRRPRS